MLWVGHEATQCFWEEPLVCEERDVSRVLLKRRFSDVMGSRVGHEATQCFWEEPLVCEERDVSRVLLKRRFSDVMVPGVTFTAVSRHR